MFFLNRLKSFFSVSTAASESIHSGQISIFDLNCCHLHFFEVKLAILFVIEIVVYQLWLNIDAETGKQLKIWKYFSLFVSSTSIQNNLFDPFSMKTTLQAAYFKNRFNRVSNCAITQDICSRLLGLLHTFVYQSYKKDMYTVVLIFLFHCGRCYLLCTCFVEFISL